MPRAIRGVNLDITDQVEARQKLRESEAKSRLLRLVVQRSPDFVGVSDTDGTPVFVNDAGLALVGMSWEEARGTAMPDYFIEEERDDVRNDVLPATLRPGRWGGELHFRHARSGEAIPVLYSVFRVDDPDTGNPTHLATITRDLRAPKRFEGARRLLIDELNHRVRNTLAIISSLASQTVRHSTSLGEFSDAFEGRIQALAATHTLLADLQREGTTLDAVLERQLRPYQQRPDAVSATGPAIALRPKPALALSLVLHELATNAAKYGALAHADGRIDITWSVIGGDRNSMVEIRWKEHGGPSIDHPPKAGFGSELIAVNIEHEFRGRFHQDYRRDGLSLTIAIPLPKTA